jgi:hypothetical protein
MAIRVSQALPRDLRFEPTPKRVRAQLGGGSGARQAPHETSDV